MTKNVRRRRITIEQREIKIVRRQSEQSLMYCERCGSIVTALIPSEIAEVFELPVGGEASEVHYIGAPDGEPDLICGGSLKQ